MKSDLMANTTEAKLQSILHMRDESAQRAMLANMRRGIGRKPGELPELWPLFMEQVPDELLDDHRGEEALFRTLTLFALHQQGHSPKDEPMHCRDTSLGRAAAELMRRDPSGDKERAKERIIRRFSILTTASDAEELYRHLKSFVQLLKANAIPLDYTDIVKALYWSDHQDTMSNIYLRWGQDFYRQINKMEGTTDEQA